MKITLAVFALSFAGIVAFPQRPAPDEIDNKKGKITIQPELHASL